jgi:hypothetical protein
MKIDLCRRHYGVYKTLKTVEITGNLSDYWSREETPNSGNDRFINEKIEEQKLLSNLPKGFLPVKPERCLITIEDVDENGNVIGAHAPDCYLETFRNWGKYFDAYVLCLR